MIGSSQAKLGASDLASREVGLCNLKNFRVVNDRVSFGQNNRWKKAGISFTLRAHRTEPVREENKRSGPGTSSKTVSFCVLFFTLCMVEERLGKLGILLSLVLKETVN